MHEDPQARPSGDGATPEPRAIRILVADDEPGIRLALSLFLRRRGHHVTQAADAHEARRLVIEHEFDVALVDARMPGDGIALLHELEQTEQLAGRTVLMTGDPGRGIDELTVAEGRPCFTKPFDLNRAAALLEQLGAREREG